MQRRWSRRRGRVATRALTALVAVGACVAAAAYATGRPATGEVLAPARVAGGRPPRPRITRHPDAVTAATTARFAFAVPRGRPRFQCRLNQGPWRRCRSSLVLEGLAVGTHRLAVRALGRLARYGPAASFEWELIEPQPFSIDPDATAFGPLFPGAPPVPVPVVLSNPNPVALLVTGVRVSVTASPPGCDGATNLELVPSTASPAAPLRLPPGGNVRLPAPGVSAPAIALRDLPFPQDACEGAEFGLEFSGEAHG